MRNVQYRVVNIEDKDSHYLEGNEGYFLFICWQKRAQHAALSIRIKTTKSISYQIDTSLLKLY